MQAVGVMEYFSVTASIFSADAAVKAADVDLVDVRLGTGIGGKSFVILTGEVAAVTEAVKAGVSTPTPRDAGLLGGHPQPPSRAVGHLAVTLLRKRTPLWQINFPAKSNALSRNLSLANRSPWPTSSNPNPDIYKKLGVIGDHMGPSAL